MDFFHELVIPILCGLVLTVAKIISDRRLLSFDESNDIALDLVLVGVGALSAIYVKQGAVLATIDAGVGDAFLAVILLYIRYLRSRRAASGHGVAPPIGPLSGIVQMTLGVGALIWTMKAV